MVQDKSTVLGQLMTSKALQGNHDTVQIQTMEEDGAPGITRYNDFSN